MGTVSLHVPGIKIISSKVTLSMNIVGSDIMMPMDIQGSYIMVPMDIQAQYMNLAIDIVAQSVGNIKMDIAAQSVGKIGISVNVADIVGNLPIDIKAQTIGNLAIDIAAQSVGKIGISVNVADIVGNLPIDIKAQTIGNLAIDIVAQTIGNINVNLAASDITLNVEVKNATINVNVQGTANISITGQTVGVNLKGDWAAQQQTDLDAGAFNYLVGSQSTANVLSYTPSGFAFYICILSIHAHGVNVYETGSVRELIPFWYVLRVAGTDKIVGGGKGSQVVTLPKPIRATSGQQVIVSVTNGQDRSIEYCVTLHGYKVT